MKLFGLVTKIINAFSAKQAERSSSSFLAEALHVVRECALPIQYDSYQNWPDVSQSQQKLFEFFSALLQDTLPKKEQHELECLVLAYLKENTDIIYNGVSRPREYNPAYLQAREHYPRTYQQVGAIHLELGSYTAFPDSRVEQLKTAEGLTEFIRLDFNQEYQPDVVADCTVLPFRSGSLDKIASNSLFEHIKYPHRAIEEAFRVLRPGGFFMIKVPFHFTEHGCPYDYLRYTPEFFKQICQEVGFEAFAADVHHAGGLYYTLHEFTKAAIVNPDVPETEAMLTLHTTLMLLLAMLTPCDDYFLGKAINFYKGVECFAVKPGTFEPRTPRPTSLGNASFVERNLDILACPVCKQALAYSSTTLVCETCHAIYPIHENTPHLIGSAKQKIISINVADKPAEERRLSIPVSNPKNRYWWYNINQNRYTPPVYSFLSDEEWHIIQQWYADTDQKSLIGESPVPLISALQGFIMGSAIGNIVQLGHFAGYSTLLIGFMMRKMQKKHAFMTIDIDHFCCDYVAGWIHKANLQDYVRIVESDSAAPELPQQVQDYFQGEINLVYIDSSHQYENTLKELDLWYPALKDGGLIFLHDTSDFAATYDSAGVKVAFEEWVAKRKLEYMNINSITPKGVPALVYQDPSGLGIIQKPVTESDPSPLKSTKTSSDK